MKLGDKVYCTHTRPNKPATIIQVDISTRYDEKGKKQVRSKYFAKYDDGSVLQFNGGMINRTVFKLEENHQMTLGEFLENDKKTCSDCSEWSGKCDWGYADPPINIWDCDHFKDKTCGDCKHCGLGGVSEFICRRDYFIIDDIDAAVKCEYFERR